MSNIKNLRDLLIEHKLNRKVTSVIYLLCRYDGRGDKVAEEILNRIYSYKIKWDKRFRRVVGRTYPNEKELVFNYYLQNPKFRSTLKAAIRHEVAHAIEWELCNTFSDHDEAWKIIIESLGANDVYVNNGMMPRDHRALDEIRSNF